MNQILDQIFEWPEKSYLKPQELSLLSKYVSSLPERIKLYRQLREQETKLMQAVVDQLPVTLTQTPTPALEQSVKQAILMLRYAAMGMLVDNHQFATQRLEGWLPAMVEAYQTQSIDQPLHRQLLTYLSRVLSPKQLELLKPGLEAAQQLLTLSAAEEANNPMANTIQLVEVS